MFVGATRYRGIHAWLRLTLTWVRMVRMMKQLPGYRWHKVYWEFPFTLGTIAMFEDRDALMRFARSRDHRKLMQWITNGERNADGGYIRVFIAQDEGYTNGVWRAEPGEQTMRHIERFTAVGDEPHGPYVDPALTRAQHRERPGGDT
ncbi:MAG: hypothetical protein JWN41_1399 [Thermoleophilia bacterium]|nr:hypothetical protein [Thermoleophilia bacterium]